MLKKVLQKVMFLKFLMLVLALGVMGYTSGVAMAQGTSTVDLTDVTLDTTSVLALAAIILTAIGAIWGMFQSLF